MCHHTLLKPRLITKIIMTKNGITSPTSAGSPVINRSSDDSVLSCLLYPGVLLSVIRLVASWNWVKKDAGSLFSRKLVSLHCTAAVFHVGLQFAVLCALILRRQDPTINIIEWCIPGVKNSRVDKEPLVYKNGCQVNGKEVSMSCWVNRAHATVRIWEQNVFCTQ